MALVGHYDKSHHLRRLSLNAIPSPAGVPLCHHDRRGSQIHLASATVEAGENPLPPDSLLRLDHFSYQHSR